MSLNTKFSAKYFVTFDSNNPTSIEQDNGTFVPLYEPKYEGVEYNHENLATTSSGRTQHGVMMLDFIQQDIVKVGLSWGYLMEDEVRYLKTRLQGKKFKFRYYDCGEMKEMYAYCGKLSYTMVTSNYQGTGLALYKDISANIIDRCGDGKSTS